MCFSNGSSIIVLLYLLLTAPVIRKTFLKLRFVAIESFTSFWFPQGDSNTSTICKICLLCACNLVLDTFPTEYNNDCLILVCDYFPFPLISCKMSPKVNGQGRMTFRHEAYIQHLPPHLRSVGNSSLKKSVGKTYDIHFGHLLTQFIHVLGHY